jgi:hypothetical protein
MYDIRMNHNSDEESAEKCECACGVSKILEAFLFGTFSRRASVHGHDGREPALHVTDLLPPLKALFSI